MRRKTWRTNSPHTSLCLIFVMKITLDGGKSICSVKCVNANSVLCNVISIWIFYSPSFDNYHTSVLFHLRAFISEASVLKSGIPRYVPGAKQAEADEKTNPIVQLVENTLVKLQHSANPLVLGMASELETDAPSVELSHRKVHSNSFIFDLTSNQIIVIRFTLRRLLNNTVKCF